jgi:hypothetical protein
MKQILWTVSCDRKDVAGHTAMSRIWKEPRKRVLFSSNNEAFSPMWGGTPPAQKQ